MKNTKVLQIFGSLGMGGAESRMMDVYRNMDRDAYTVDFLTMQDGIQHYEPELKSMGANVIHIENPREVNIFRHISQLRKTMRQGQYQAVHAHTSYHCGVALLAAWLVGVPVRISHARTTGSRQRSLKSKVSSLIGRTFIRLFSTNRLAISQEAGNYLFGKQTFQVVPNAICVENYMNTTPQQADCLKQQLEIPKNAFVIGQIGRFDEMKNHRFTLKWFAQYSAAHSDAHLVFVGDGALRPEMESLAEALGVQSRVTFTGIRSDVSQLVHVFDVLLFPSVFEGLGGVALEAQAAGVPVVESENIPPEADVQLGMVTKCSLNAEFSVWSEAVDACRGFAAPCKEEITAAFYKKGYSIDAVTQTYCRLYTGENDENLDGNYNHL